MTDAAQRGNARKFAGALARIAQAVRDGSADIPSTVEAEGEFRKFERAIHPDKHSEQIRLLAAGWAKLALGLQRGDSE
jgi:hypothetical protein